MSTNGCSVLEAATIELYFYGELDRVERATVSDHLRGCRDCAEALAEMKVIREALGSRPDVAAPPGDDWSLFMARLDSAVTLEARPRAVVEFTPRPAAVRRPVAVWLAAAATLAIVSAGVFVVSRTGRTAIGEPGVLEPASMVTSGPVVDLPISNTGMASVGQRHLERSKLVVLGLAAKESAGSPAGDWAYERELATSLLNDTRLYRMAAEERGLVSLAGVMKDLELVLLQTAMAQESDATALPQIQRLIRKRALVEKMDVVATTGMVP